MTRAGLTRASGRNAFGGELVGDLSSSQATSEVAEDALQNWSFGGVRLEVLEARCPSVSVRTLTDWPDQLGSSLRQQIREDRVAVVAAYNHSRLARSVTIWAEFQELMYEHTEIQVVFAHGTFDALRWANSRGVNVAAADQLLREMAGVTRKE